MTTRCVVQLVHSDINHINAVAQQIYQNTKRLESTYNFFSPTSWLTQAINQRQQAQVSLPEEAWEIFTTVRQLSEQTHGVFDISVGTLRLPPALQSQATNDKRIAELTAKYQQGFSRQQISEQMQSAMGLAAWSLDEQTRSLCCHHWESRFDLGGVVKEFAVDAAISIAQQAGCGAMISFGGDLKVSGKKADGSDYKVGIKNPFNPSQTCLSVPLTNQALTTSGNYERHDQVGQQQLSHLIANSEKVTIKESYDKGSAGILAQCQDDDGVSLPASVTVISPNTLISGVFSTALMLNPNLPLPSVAQSGGIIKVIMVDQSAKLSARSNAK